MAKAPGVQQRLVGSDKDAGRRPRARSSYRPSCLASTGSGSDDQRKELVAGRNVVVEYVREPWLVTCSG